MKRKITPMTSSIPADQETLNQKTPAAIRTADAPQSDQSDQSEQFAEQFGHGITVDNLDLLLDVLPPQVREALVQESGLESLLEVVLDLGRQAEARYVDKTCYLLDTPVNHDDIQFAVTRVGMFTHDNRAGIPRTLHRISAIRNRMGDTIGLTCRVGRAVYGTVNIVKDLITEDKKSILLLGPPGVGKTTLLREVARSCEKGSASTVNWRMRAGIGKVLFTVSTRLRNKPWTVAWLRTLCQSPETPCFRATVSTKAWFGTIKAVIYGRLSPMMHAQRGHAQPHQYTGQCP